jgi:hypothetical protein
MENCLVDLDYHVRCMRLHGRGDQRDLDQVIGEIASTPLSRDHPLWEFYYVAGLSGGRVALVGKIHHALADGVASANLLARAMDLIDAPADDGRVAESCTPPSSRELLWAAGRDHARQVVRLPSLLAQAGAGAWRLRRRARERGDQPDLARLLEAPPSPPNQRRIPGAHLAGRHPWRTGTHGEDTRDHINADARCSRCPARPRPVRRARRSADCCVSPDALTVQPPNHRNEIGGMAYAAGSHR